VSLTDYLLQNPSVIAAFLSTIATICAVFATWQGPRSAAKLAERIRHDQEKALERRRMKMHVFSTLMQERATIASLDSVRMLNSIDFVFHDAPAVREAWSELFVIFETSGTPHPQLREEKLRVLLREMAADLGLSDALKTDDLGRIYYPNALAREEELRMLQQERALLSFRSSSTGDAPQPDPNMMAKFPPKPN